MVNATLSLVQYNKSLHFLLSSSACALGPALAWDCVDKYYSIPNCDEVSEDHGHVCVASTDSIEANVENAEVHVERGAEQLQRAAYYQVPPACRRYSCCHSLGFVLVSHFQIQGFFF